MITGTKWVEHTERAERAERMMDAVVVLALGAFWGAMAGGMVTLAMARSGGTASLVNIWSALLQAGFAGALIGVALAAAATLAPITRNRRLAA